MRSTQSLAWPRDHNHKSHLLAPNKYSGTFNFKEHNNNNSNFNHKSVSVLEGGATNSIHIKTAHMLATLGRTPAMGTKKQRNSSIDDLIV